MKLALLTQSLSRKGGGLFDCARLLGKHLMSQESTHVEAFGFRDESTTMDENSWKPVPQNVFTGIGPTQFQISPAMNGALAAFRPDVAHTIGLWSYPSVVVNQWQRRSGRPHLVSPQGMLDPWALGNSAWKKRLAAAAFENRHLRSASCLHALNASEYNAMREYGLENPICVIPNGVEMPSATGCDAPWPLEFGANRKILLYLSRLHPKKGLHNLINAWALLQETSPKGNESWGLVIAGWGDPTYVAELKRLATGLGIEKSVYFAGPLFGLAKEGAYQNANAFILPSFSEGQPLVILEAWSHRLPVVMTPACNLPEGVANGAAIESGLQTEDVLQALRSLIDLSPDDRIQMGNRGERLVAEKFTWQKIAHEMREVYNWVTGLGPRPESIRIN